MKDIYTRFATAVTFLTVFPVPFSRNHTFVSSDLARSFAFFPPAGLILGVCSLFPALLFKAFMPPMLSAVLVTTLLVVLTRGLHLDGLADLADGVGGGYTPKRRLEIMKDSRIGTFGAAALALAILFKVAGLYALIAANQWSTILLVPAFSRLTMVFAAYRSPYARAEGGLGKPFLEHMTKQELLTATTFACLAALVIAPGLIFPYLLAGLVCAAVLRFFAGRWLGGITGDVLGATNELSEIVLLALSACMLTHF